MANQLQVEQKKILTLRVKQNIEAGKWQKLIAALPVAEEAGIDSKLLLKSYLLLGEYFNKKEPFSDAIVYYSKAISITDDESVYMKLVGSIKLFYNLFQTKFCKSDLQSLQTFLRFLYNKTSLAYPNSFALLSELKSILNDVKELELSTANELIESPATPWVNKIYNSFYRPKNPQEVFERSSDVMLEWIQPFYDEESKKEVESKKKKRKSKKKKEDKKE